MVGLLGVLVCLLSDAVATSPPDLDSETIKKILQHVPEIPAFPTKNGFYIFIPSILRNPYYSQGQPGYASGMELQGNQQDSPASSSSPKTQGQTEKEQNVPKGEHEKKTVNGIDALSSNLGANINVEGSKRDSSSQISLLQPGADYILKEKPLPPPPKTYKVKDYQKHLDGMVRAEKLWKE